MHIIKVQALSASLLATLAVSAPVSLGGQAQVRSAQTPKSGEFFYRDVEAPVVETESTTTGPNGSLDWLRARDRTAHIDRARRQGNISPGRGAWIFQEVPGSETEDAASVKRARAPDVADSAEKTRGVTTYGPNIYYAAGVDVPGETAKTAGANIASGPNGAQDWLLEDGDDSASIKARAPQGFEKGSYAYRKTAGPVSKDLADTSSHPSVQTSNVEADGEVQASSVGVLDGSWSFSKRDAADVVEPDTAGDSDAPIAAKYVSWWNFQTRARGEKPRVHARDATDATGDADTDTDGGADAQYGPEYFSWYFGLRADPERGVADSDTATVSRRSAQDSNTDPDAGNTEPIGDGDSNSNSDDDGNSEPIGHARDIGAQGAPITSAPVGDEEGTFSASRWVEFDFGNEDDIEP